MGNLHDIMNEALELWIKIRGITEEGNNYYLDVECKEIKDAQKIDSSGLTALMILNAQVRDYAREHKFTMLECIENHQTVNDEIKQINDLLTILNQKLALDAINEFQQQINKMAKTCDVEGIFNELIKDTVELAYIRRDALIASKYMNIHNFRRGKRAKKLQYNKSVVKFWNINSALQAAELQPVNGITLVMIRDPVILYSHFMFLIHSGENITVWTDQENETHPLQKYMSRGRAQERRWESRAFRLRFPYQLFDLDFDDEGKFIKEDGKDALVRTNVKAVPIKELRELPPDQVLWILMMFDVISNKKHKKIRSYTGEGVVETNRKLIGSVSTPDITRNDVTRENLKNKKVFERESTGQNDWLEDRYADKVPEKVYNVITSPDGPSLLSDGSPIKLGSIIRGKEYITSHGYHSKLSLIGLEPRVFGTPKEMESDRLWIARYNQAIMIQSMADKEFQKKHKEIERWYEAGILANINFILEAIARGTLPGIVKKRKCFSDYPVKGEILTQCMYKRWRPWEWKSQVNLWGWDEDKRKTLCHISGQTAWIWTRITPIVVEDIARLAGDEVPEIIQNWTMIEPYEGNS
ncbi:hypothetical protein KAR91_79860, partial [Candidatus Pacearchaeota archaeon]|nr:hypothetical protein [Candidatus Pacearchaeota archaeon]